MRIKAALPILLTIASFSAVLPAHALIGLNQCGAGTRPPVGMHCGHDNLLLGYRDATGACVWVCCPPNSDGSTYNCSGPATPSDVKLDLGRVPAKQWKEIFKPGPSYEVPAQK